MPQIPREEKLLSGKILPEKKILAPSLLLRGKLFPSSWEWKIKKLAKSIRKFEGVSIIIGVFLKVGKHCPKIWTKSIPIGVFSQQKSRSGASAYVPNRRAHMSRWNGRPKKKLQNIFI